MSIKPSLFYFPMFFCFEAIELIKKEKNTTEESRSDSSLTNCVSFKSYQSPHLQNFKEYI